MGCDPDDGVSWSPGDAGDPCALIEAAQRRWTVGPVDQDWPLAVGAIDEDLRVDLVHHRAVLRVDRVRGTASVLAHDAVAAEGLLARLRRPPLPVHAPHPGTPVTPDLALSCYVAARPPWPESAYFGGRQPRWCRVATDTLRVETVRAEGRYVTRVSGADDVGGTAGLLAAWLRLGAAVGWLGAGRSLDLSRPIGAWYATQEGTS